MYILSCHINSFFRVVIIFWCLLPAFTLLNSKPVIAQDESQVLLADTIIGNQKLQKATELAQSGQFDSARYYLGEASEVYRKVDMWDKYFYAQSQIGYLFSREYKYKETIHHLDSIETQFADNLEPGYSSFVQFYRVLAWCHLSLINYQEALHYFALIDKGIELNASVELSHVLFSNYYQGVIYQRIGQYDRALDFMLRTKEICDKGNDKSYLGTTYNNLGIIYRNLGEYERALEFYKKALVESGKFEEKVRLTPIYNNIGRVHYLLQAYDQALSELDFALDILTSYTSDYYPIESALNNSKALVLMDYGDVDSAEKILIKLLERELDKYGEMGTWSTETLLNLGRLYGTLEDYDQSNNFYRQSIEITRRDLGIKNDKQAETLNLLGTNLLKTGNLIDALSTFQQCLISLAIEFNDTSYHENPGINMVILDKVELIEAQYLKAKSLVALFEQTHNKEYLNSAQCSNKSAIDLTEIVRQNMLYESSKLQLSEKAKLIYEQTIEIALLEKQENGVSKVDNIFLSMENSKSFLLTEALQKAESLGYSSLPDSIKAREAKFKTKIQILETEQANALIHGQDSATLEHLAQEIFQAKERFENFKLELGQSFPKYVNSRYQFPIPGIKDIQLSLSKNDLIVEYFAGVTNLYAIAISNTTAEVYSLGNFEQKLADFVTVLQQAKTLDAGRFQNSSGPLFNLILKPIVDDNKTKHELIIIPDAQLGYIPFDALVTESIENPKYTNLEYLINDFTVLQHQSVSLFLFDQEKSQAAEGYIGFAPDFSREELDLFADASSVRGEFQYLQPLPFARQEVESISGLLHGELAINEMANENYFKSKASGYEVLHVATHAIIDEDNPIYSRLIFAKVDSLNQDDGLLHSYEIYGLDLNSKLVTLSACNTGTGKLLDGEGIFSLGRSFLQAGAESVLTSLWEVPDQSTSKIMELFYANLKKGQTMPQGLRKAKLQYLKKADHLTANPYYWAGFVYIGKSEPLYTSKSIYYWIALIVLLGSGAWFWRRQHNNQKASFS